MKRRVLAAMLLATTAKTGFRFERAVFPAPGAPETCIALPVEVLEHASPGLGDMRLMAGEHEVAYRLRTSNEAIAEESKPQKLLNLGERAGLVSFDVEMTERRYHQVMLRLARSHFSVLVRISGMNQLGEPGTALPQAVLSANASEEQPQQRRISLPESSFRYLHFEVQTLALDPVGPADIAGVAVIAASAEPTRFTTVAVAKPPREQKQATVYEFSVPANMPLEQLRFHSRDPHAVFSRMARLERYASGAAPVREQTTTRSRDRASEVPIQSDVVVLSQQKRLSSSAEDSAHTVGVAQMRAVPSATTVRLTVENGDDTPLALDAVALEIREWQLCFLPGAQQTFLLRYGNPALASPQYDLSPIEAAEPDAAAGSLGPEWALAAAPASTVPFTERHPVLLWIALLAVVSTLGLVALRSARHSSL